MGSWNIGAFIVATNNFAIIGEGFRPQIISTIEKVLNVNVVIQRIYEEDLIGCLIVANSNGIIVPSEALDAEVLSLKRRLGLNVEKVEFRGTFSNAIGNIILLGDRRAAIHMRIYDRNRETIRRIEDTLGVEVVPFETEITDAIASYAVVNSRGIVVSPLFSEDEIEELRKIFGVPRERVVVSTINMGNPIIRSGCVANDHGVLVGNKTSGIELARIFNALIKEE